MEMTTNVQEQSMLMNGSKIRAQELQTEGEEATIPKDSSKSNTIISDVHISLCSPRDIQPHENGVNHVSKNDGSLLYSIQHNSELMNEIQKQISQMKQKYSIPLCIPVRKNSEV